MNTQIKVDKTFSSGTKCAPAGSLIARLPLSLALKDESQEMHE